MRTSHNSGKITPLTGPYGRLTVHGTHRKDGATFCTVSCSCDPEKQFKVRAASLKSGETKSCGCLRREFSGQRLRNWWAA